MSQGPKLGYARDDRSHPVGNTNRVTHGMRMALNELPKGCGRIRKERYRMRQAIEGAVLDQDGTISPYQACVIQTAIRWATHAALAARWLRFAPELTIEQKLSLSKAVAQGSENKDRCLKALGLDRTHNANPWDALSQPVTTLDDGPSDGNGSAEPHGAAGEPVAADGCSGACQPDGPQTPAQATQEADA